MTDFPENAFQAEVDARLSLLETKSVGIDSSDVRAIAREVIAPELGTMALELEGLRNLAASQGREIEILRKRIPPDVHTTVLDMLSPMMDEMIGLEQRVVPIAAVAESAQAARNAAESGVKSAEIALLSFARTFVHGE